MPGGGELRFPKTITRGDISVKSFEIGRGGGGGGGCRNLPNTVSFVFLLSFLCFYFLFFFCYFLCLPLIIACSLFLLCGDAGATFTGFLLLRLALAAKEGPKTGVMAFLLVELCWTGHVCRLRRVLQPCIQGQVSVQWRFAWFAGRFRWLVLQWISLVRFDKSCGFCCFRTDGLFRTFVEAAVVVGCACVSKSPDYSLPCRLVNEGLGEYKKKKNSNSKIIYKRPIVSP